MFTSLTLITVGISFITFALYPIVEYQITIAPKFAQHTVLSKHITQTKQQQSIDGPKFVPELITTSLDYTDATNWFNTKQVNTSIKSHVSKISYYTLSIPALGIKNALVKVGGKDLKSSLVQYIGTALPGDLGNPVIYGHSVLPQFFDPKNYTRIFSTLHELSKGDEIDIQIDGVEYKYTVTDMYEVEPEDLSPLAQTYDGYHLTLITCTPPGTYLRRLIVKADLL
jgi:sortase A